MATLGATEVFSGRWAMASSGADGGGVAMGDES